MSSSAGDGSFPLIGVDRNSPLLLRGYVRLDTQGVGSVTSGYYHYMLVGVTV